MSANGEGIGNDDGIDASDSKLRKRKCTASRHRYASLPIESLHMLLIGDDDRIDVPQRQPVHRITNLRIVISSGHHSDWNFAASAVQLPDCPQEQFVDEASPLSLIHISEPTRLGM